MKIKQSIYKSNIVCESPFELTTKEDRMRTCYMQALAGVNFEGISNSEFRKIFGLGRKRESKVSTSTAVADLVAIDKVMDPDSAPR
ncbi:MAG: hypothetical protein ACLSEY_14830 [Enterocloster sp.]